MKPTVRVHLYGGPDDMRSPRVEIDIVSGVPLVDELPLPAGYSEPEVETDATGHPSTARWVSRWAYSHTGNRRPPYCNGTTQFRGQAIACGPGCPSRRTAPP